MPGEGGGGGEKGGARVFSVDLTGISSPPSLVVLVRARPWDGAGAEDGPSASAEVTENVGERGEG
jgi:hypothetical protein